MSSPSDAGASDFMLRMAAECHRLRDECVRLSSEASTEGRGDDATALAERASKFGEAMEAADAYAASGLVMTGHPQCKTMVVIDLIGRQVDDALELLESNLRALDSLQLCMVVKICFGSYTAAGKEPPLMRTIRSMLKSNGRYLTETKGGNLFFNLTGLPMSPT